MPRGKIKDKNFASFFFHAKPQSKKEGKKLYFFAF
jgi:hypothetical protein